MIKTIDECFFQIQNGANIKQGDVDGGFPITRIETTANDKFNRDRMGYAGITDISKYECRLPVKTATRAIFGGHPVT